MSRLKGRHIGSGIGYLLKFIDLPLEEIPIAWLKNVINVSDKTMDVIRFRVTWTMLSSTTGPKVVRIIYFSK